MQRASCPSPTTHCPHSTGSSKGLGTFLFLAASFIISVILRGSACASPQTTSATVESQNPHISERHTSDSRCFHLSWREDWAAAMRAQAAAHQAFFPFEFQFRRLRLLWTRWCGIAIVQLCEHCSSTSLYTAAHNEIDGFVTAAHYEIDGVVHYRSMGCDSSISGRTSSCLSDALTSRFRLMRLPLMELRSTSASVVQTDRE